MRIRRRKRSQQKNSSLISPTSIPSRFQPYSFGETTSNNPEVTQTQSETNQSSEPRLVSGFNFGNIAISTPKDPQNNPVIQPKLTIGKPNDKYEQEADSVAEQVVQNINTPQNPNILRQEQAAVPTKPNNFFSIQRQDDPEDEEIQAKFNRTQSSFPQQVFRQANAANNSIPEGTATSAFESSLNQAKGGGEAISDKIRQPMESSFGSNFSQVRIHHNQQSDRLNQSIQAKAFTTGTNIFFKQGAYQPESREGQKLIAHELTHVVQQNGASVKRSPISSLSGSSVIQRDIEVSEADIGYQNVLLDLQTQVPRSFIYDTVIPNLTAKGNERLNTGKLGQGQNKQRILPKTIKQNLAQGGVGAIQDSMDPEVPAQRDVSSFSPNIIQENLTQDDDVITTAFDRKANQLATSIALKYLKEPIQRAVNRELSNCLVRTQTDSNVPLETVDEFRQRLELRVNTAMNLVWQNRRDTLKRILDRRLKKLSQSGDLVNELQGDVNQQSEQLGKTELDHRLNRNTTVNQIVTNLNGQITNHTETITQFVQDYLEDKVGALGAGRLRSTQLREFRGAAKKLARQQTQGDIHQQMEDQYQDQPATQKYMLMKAEQRGYKEAKYAANSALKALATDGTEIVLREARTTQLLNDTARQAAWAILRGGGNTNTAQDNALTQLNKFAKQHKHQVLLIAKNWKNDLIKSQDSQQRRLNREQISEKARQRAEEMEIGRKVVRETITADSPENAMSILSVLLDTVVPDPGNQASLDIELNIPVYQGVYILLGIKGTAARGLSGVINAAPTLDADNDRVEVRGDFTFGAGVQAFGFKADGSVGLFLRAGSANSTKAAQAMSYGLYRYLANKSEKMASWWSGTSNGTDLTAIERSETWAAMMEEQVFQDDTSAVDTGVYGRVRAKAGLTEDISAGVTIMGGGFDRYNKTSIGDQLGQTPENATEADQRRHGIGGQRMGAFGIKFTGSFGSIGGANLGFTAAWTKDELKTWELSLSGNISLGGSDEVANVASQAALGVGTAVAKLIRLLNENEDKPEKVRNISSSLNSLKSTIDSTAAPSIEDELSGLYQVESNQSTALNGDTIPAKSSSGIASSKKARLTIAIGKSGSNTTFRVSVDEIATTKVTIPGLGKVQYDKSRRIVSGGNNSGGIRVL